MCPYADYGSKASFERGSLFIEPKEKNDKIIFRILSRPYYKAQHFQKLDDGKWNVFDCPKIMEEQYCEECDFAMKLYREAKQMKENKESKDAVDKKKEEAKRHKASVKWYYPAINREKEEAIILRVSLMVRNYLDSEFLAGIDILKRDYILLVTKEVGPNYYKVTVAQNQKDFTEKEVKQVEIAKSWDLEALVKGKQSSQNVDQEVPAPTEPY